jgi:hypothetical protein
LNAAWKIEAPMNFWSFREKLLVQMLEYNPSRRKYPGDYRMRAATQQSLHQRQVSQDLSIRRRRAGRPSNLRQAVPRPGVPLMESASTGITMQHLNRASFSHGNNSRLCGDLTRLQRHLASIVNGKHHPKKCVVCGEPSYSVCKLCGNKPLHFLPKSGKSAGKDCFFDYHSDSFFGLAADDTAVATGARAKWTPPSQTKRKRHARRIADLKSGDTDTDSSALL